MSNFSSISHLLKPVQNISFGHGEKAGPIEIPHTEAPVTLKEVVEHEPAPEVAGVVQVKKDTVDIPPDLQQMGVQSTGTSDFATEKDVELPISDDQVYTGLKAPITSSIRWLAEMCLKILKHAHKTLKEAHGHIMRVEK